MAKPQRRPQGGIRTLEDLRLRSVVDDITGCWNVRSFARYGGVYLWFAPLDCTVSLTKAMAYLITGDKAPKGKLWWPTCHNTGCGNPAHRQLGTWSEMRRALHPSMTPLQRARITLATRARSRHFSPELRHEIITSSLPASVIAKREGMDLALVCRIRKGQAWRECTVGASVFNLAGQP